MEIKDFIKSVLLQLNNAVDEARKETSRDISFTNTVGKRTVEFDIAVTAEDSINAKGKAGIKVVSFAEVGGDIAKDSKNSTVSRIQFGLHISAKTKDEAAREAAAMRGRNNGISTGFY